MMHDEIRIKLGGGTTKNKRIKGDWEKERRKGETEIEGRW